MKKIDKIIDVFRNSNYTEINSKAAEMSFYLLLSLFPFLMFTISTIAYMPVIQINKYILLFEHMMPESAFNMISAIIYSAMKNKSKNFIITSFLLTMWTSSRAVRAMIRGANKSYKVEETRSFIKVFFISILSTITLLFLIFSSMVFLVYGEKIGYFIFGLIGLDKIFMYIWDILRYTIGILTLVIILISIYRYSPNKKVKMSEATPGAIISTIGWILVSLGYSYYSNYYANYEVIYGSIGGIIVLITWIYLSSWAILIGIEINAKIYLRRNIYKYKFNEKI